MSATLHVFKEVVATGCTKTTMRLPATGTIFVLSKITSIYLISLWKNKKISFHIYLYQNYKSKNISFWARAIYLVCLLIFYTVLNESQFWNCKKITSKLPYFYIQQLIFMHFVLAWKLVYKYEFFVRLVKDKITSAINNWKIVSSTINVSPPTQRSC